MEDGVVPSENSQSQMATSQPSIMIGIDELARELGVTVAYLKRTWPRLHETKGMPRKHAAGWVWPRALTTAWLMSQTAALPAQQSNDNDPEQSATAHRAQVDAQRAALHARYGGRA